MKRIIILILAMMSVTMSVFAVSNAKCLLQHKGTVKIYDASAIENAIKNAVDGDTVFLTAGSFPGFTLNKKITVRGAGQSTKINGDVCISIPGSPTLTQTILEGVDTQQKDVTLTTPMKGVKIKQCSIYNLRTNANNNDIVIDRCCITAELCYSSYIKSMTVINSIVTIGCNYASTDNVINFINCYTTAYYIGKCSGTFINSIVYGRSYNSSYRIFNNCNFVNTLLCGDYTSYNQNTCTVQNCYTDTKNYKFDVNTLENLGYFGNDNTIVGEYGGLTPYTLELSIPKVTESTIILDSEKKVLNVSLKVTAN